MAPTTRASSASRHARCSRTSPVADLLAALLLAAIARLPISPTNAKAATTAMAVTAPIRTRFVSGRPVRIGSRHNHDRDTAEQTGDRQRGHLPVPVDRGVKKKGNVGAERDRDERVAAHLDRGDRSVRKTRAAATRARPVQARRAPRRRGCARRGSSRTLSAGRAATTTRRFRRRNRATGARDSRQPPRATA